MFNMHITANLLRNLPVKKMSNRRKITYRQRADELAASASCGKYDSLTAICVVILPMKNVVVEATVTMAASDVTGIGECCSQRCKAKCRLKLVDCASK